MEIVAWVTEGRRGYTIRMIRLLSLVVALATLAQAQVERFNFDVQTLGGRRITQDEFKDSVVLVDMWGTWCPPCRAAIPELMELYAKYKHHGFEIVGLNYERGDPAEAIGKIREFATKNKVTYTLAIGTPEIQKQILGFSGYPTLLFFKKGMKFDHMDVGFTAGDGKKIETWIRGQLGLDGEAGGDQTAGGGEEEGGAGSRPKPAAVAKVGPTLEKGVVYMPGDGDTGFDFELQDPAGKAVRFADSKGKVTAVPLLLAGDAASARLATALDALQKKYGDKGLTVAGACFARSRDATRKKEEVKAFASEQKLEFPLGVADLSFIKKVHNAGAFPLLLIFDREQVLKVRVTGVSKESEESLEKSVREVLGLDV
jgi:thiol-disulfide isomerase/thioredoxin